ncbi:unnamed protein product, partial [Tetraodon nigroviridis]
ISETEPVDVQLLSCHNNQLLDSKTLDLQNSQGPKWEVLDVWEIFKEQRCLDKGTRFCVELRVMMDNPEREVDLHLLGLHRHGRPQQKKAILVVFTRPDELHESEQHATQLLRTIQTQPHQHPLHRLRQQRGLQTVRGHGGGVVRMQVVGKRGAAGLHTSARFI